ncbi:hypothetical protein HQ41_03835 [Porphyromonas sp. COT-290 OH860]|nr:hypothetical protein HQ41_03835 [Porphyromonas sp. COT-290 OH860]
MEQVLYLEAINAAAVPLFFMITGYFLFHDNAEVTYRNIVKAIKRIMPIIIILQVVYYPFAPIHEDLFRGWVLYARLVFMGFHSFKTIHLWYLTALLEGLVFFAVYLKIFKKKGVGCLVALSITGILLGRYRFLGGEASSLLTYNAVSYAIPFLALGYWVKENESFLIKSKHWFDCTLCVVVLLFVEYTFLMKYSYAHSTEGIFLMTLPLVLSVFVSCLKNGKLGVESKLSSIGKRYAGNIYYFHLIIAYGVSFCLSLMGLEDCYQSFGTLIVFVMSLGFAYLIVKVQNRLGLQILR